MGVLRDSDRCPLYAPTCLPRQSAMRQASAARRRNECSINHRARVACLVVNARVGSDESTRCFTIKVES